MTAAKLWLENIAGLNKAGSGGDREAAAIRDSRGSVEASAGILTPDGVLKVTLKLGDKVPIEGIVD